MADSETMSLVDAIEYIRNDEAHAAALAGLQEVREVLKLVAHPKFDAGGDGIHYYVTKADIERARALMLKLEVRP